MMRNYWWPGISKYVLNYVDGRDVCADGGKPFPEMLAGKVVNAESYSKCALDGYFHGFYYGITWSSRLQRNTSCMDRFTKQVHIIPTMKEMNSLGLVCLYWDHIWKLHGLPNTVISDHGPQFASGFMKGSIRMIWESTQIIYHLSPTDRWTDREDESGVGAIFEDVHGLPTKRIGWSGLGNCWILI